MIPRLVDKHDPILPGKPARPAEAVESYPRDGFAGPLPLFTRDQCRLILRHYRYDRTRKQAEWGKGIAAVDPFYYELAARPQLLELLEPVLGPDIILWGCSIIQRMPGKAHPWHTDIESSRPEGGFASIWIGLEHTCRDSALCFIAGSHAYGASVQEVRQRNGVARPRAADENIGAWAREYDPAARVIDPEMRDGDGILFDGRLWHGTRNLQTTGQRSALLLQYAAADRPVFRPNLNQFDWPFRFDEEHRPPVVVVKGKADAALNRVAPPPFHTRPRSRPIWNEIAPLRAPLPLTPGQSWTPHRLFRGPSGNHNFLSVHASALAPGCRPHPPHVHVEEEILVVLDGHGEILTGNGPEPEKAERTPVEPGSFAYYPAYQFHSIQNTGQTPLTYLMFKWPGPPHEVEGALPLTLVHTGGMAARERPGKAFKTRRLFNGPTGYLRRLHGHLSVMDPGQGYAPHRDKHDVAIILFSGKLQANDEVIAPHTVVYHSGGSLHGLSNVGEEPARYLVFEFEHPEGQRDPRPGRKRKRERKSKGKTRGKERQAVPLTLMERLSREIRRPFRRLRLPKRIRRRLFPRRAGDSAQGTGQGGDA